MFSMYLITRPVEKQWDERILFKKKLNQDRKIFRKKDIERIFKINCMK